MYPQEITVGAMMPESTWITAAQSLTQAAATYGVWTAHYPVIVQRLSFKVSTSVNNLTGSVIVANLITNVQNATPTTAAIGTITVANGTTAGAVYWNNITPTLLTVGSQLQFQLKTQGALGGTPAGAGFCGFYGTLSPDVAKNETANCILVTA